MKRILFLIFVFVIISIAACQKPVSKDLIKQQAPKIQTTNEKIVDSVGSDLNVTDSVENDISAEDLSDLDSGLQDIQNI